MSLRLTVQGETWPAGVPRSVEVSERPITIGRDPSCDWILTDPGVSPRHALITPVGAGYRLKALSTTSPTSINDPLRPLKVGDSTALGPGDVIYLHAYRIRVEELAVSVQPVSAPKPSSAQAGGIGRFSGRVSDLMGSGLAPRIEPPVLAPIQVRNSAAEDAPTKPLEAPAAGRVLVLEARGSAWPDNTPRRFVVRRRSIEIGREPPCDWILRDRYISARHARISYEGGFYVLEVQGNTNPTAVNEASRRLRPGDRVALARGDLIYLDTFVVGVDLIIDDSPDPPVQRPLPAREPAPVAGTPGTLDDVLRGAGIDPKQVSLTTERAESLGAALKSAVAGAQQLLRAQKVVTQEFRLPHARFAPRNPLQQSDDVDEALRLLLRSPAAERDEALASAFAEAFTEITSHELAVLEGLRAGFDEVMRALDPDSLERRFNSRPRPWVFGGSAAHYWSEYSSLMRGLATDPEHRYETLFGEAFALAYENALERVRLAHSRQKSPQ